MGTGRGLRLDYLEVEVVDVTDLLDVAYYILPYLLLLLLLLVSIAFIGIADFIAEIINQPIRRRLHSRGRVLLLPSLLLRSAGNDAQV